MTKSYAYVDDRGPETIALVCDADARRQDDSWSQRWSDILLVSRRGSFAYLFIDHGWCVSRRLFMAVRP